MKKIVSRVYLMMCALFLVNIAQASESKSATQKSNRVALDATTRWLAATLTKSGGEKYADEDMQFSISYQKASFKNGVGHVKQRIQRYVSYELNEGEIINDHIEEVTFDMKRLDADTVEATEHTSITSSATNKTGTKNKIWYVTVKSRIPADVLAVQTKRTVKIDHSTLPLRDPSGVLRFTFTDGAIARQFSHALAFAISIS